MSDLTLTEQKHVRTTLRVLRRQLGTWAAVGDALRCAAETAKKAASGHDGVSAGMAIRVARLAGVTVDDLLEGRCMPDACPKCGHVPDFADEPTFVEDAPPRLGCGLTLVK